MAYGFRRLYNNMNIVTPDAARIIIHRRGNEIPDILRSKKPHGKEKRVHVYIIHICDIKRKGVFFVLPLFIIMVVTVY